MVIPKKHILSFSELNSIELEELFTVIEDIKLIYRKYQEKEISPVEKAYLEILKDISKKIDDKES